MNIALDFDDTYTRDPLVWDNVIGLMKKFGHNIFIVTMRYPGYEAEEVNEYMQSHDIVCYFTGRRAKKQFMYEQGICVDVWIDDNPFAILNDLK